MPAENRNQPGVAAQDRPLFDAAARSILRYLRAQVPMALWSVTRVENDRQTYVLLGENGYGLEPGQSEVWQDTFCIHMAGGSAPRVAPDVSAVPTYAAAADKVALRIGAYAGAPITEPDGSLFGTICGIDPEVHEGLAAAEPLLGLLAELLTLALAADRFRDESHAALLEAQLTAETDALTSLYNRTAWERLTAEEAERFARLADPTAVVIVDLDDLKQLNDNDGHGAGDDYLRRAAAALRGVVRDSDPVARLGGDEFGVLLRHCSRTDAEARATAIRDALAARGVRASVGVAAASPLDGLSSAIRAADTAMYADKRGRRTG